MQRRASNRAVAGAHIERGRGAIGGGQQRIVITTARMELPEPAESIESMEALPAAAEPRLLIDEAA